MIKAFLVIGYSLLFFAVCHALVEEIKPPDEFLACLKVRMDKNDPDFTSYESLNNFCIASNRNKQTAKVEGPHLNISTETVDWINELLRMSEVDIHERAKRQAIQNNDTIPLPPYLQFVFPSQFGSSPLYPPQQNTAAQGQQQQQSQQNTASQTQANSQRTFVQPASVQQNPFTSNQNAQVSAQAPQAPQGPQIQGQIGQSSNGQIQAGRPQIPAQVPAQTAQIPAQVPIQTAQVPTQVPMQVLVQNAQIPGQVPSVQNPAQVPFQPAQVPVQTGQTQGQFARNQQQFQQGSQQQQIQQQIAMQRARQQMARPQVRQLRVRKEYRRLTDAERQRYHRAILMMKADTSVPPNRFDALGLIHFRMVDNIHHGGAFLAWHRIFICIYENALRQKVPDVTLPYFDSTMDETMIDPTQSIIWSPGFLGNGNGLVTTGPFAYWQTPSGPLIRNTGNPGGNLFSKQNIQTILTRTRNAEILEPGASNNFNIENLHGDVHTWIGGQMEPMETSAFDPIFYMHHAFVDYVWEIFRSNQRQQGIDPTQDYPQNYGAESHAPFTRTGFGNLVNGFGLSNMFTAEVYTYEPNPSCSFNSPNCGSNYLTCDISTGIPTCIPITAGGGQNMGPMGPPPPAGFGGGVAGPMLPGFMPNAMVGRKKRAADKKVKKLLAKRKVKVDTTPKPKLPPGVSNELQTCALNKPSFSSQNTFEIEGKADTRKWVFIPVRIVSKRSPESKNFKAFPIYDGVAARDFDIYSPESYSDISPYFQDEITPKSTRCLKKAGVGQSVGRVHIRSDGLNYRGTYDEYVIVDLRQAFMESTTYIGLRDPEVKFSEVLISAYDSCGRKCRAFCRNEIGKTSGFHECVGSVRVTNQAPYGFGKNYGSAVKMSWDLENSTIPEFQSNSVHIQFFCDHQEY